MVVPAAACAAPGSGRFVACRKARTATAWLFVKFALARMCATIAIRSRSVRSDPGLAWWQRLQLVTFTSTEARMFFEQVKQCAKRA